MVEGAAAAGRTDAVTILTAAVIAFNIATPIVARLVGSIFGVPSLLLASLTIGDASPYPYPFAAPFTLTMMG